MDEPHWKTTPGLPGMRYRLYLAAVAGIFCTAFPLIIIDALLITDATRRLTATIYVALGSIAFIAMGRFPPRGFGGSFLLGVGAAFVWLAASHFAEVWGIAWFWAGLICVAVSCLAPLVFRAALPPPQR